MDPCDIWTCPSCGAGVCPPTYCRLPERGSEAEHKGRLTRAVCGCWVAGLPESATLRLFEAFMTGLAIRGVCRLDEIDAVV